MDHLRRIDGYYLTKMIRHFYKSYIFRSRETKCKQALPDCVFCKIVNKAIPADIAYEDDLVVAFNDIHPKAPIHQLIIPRKHIATVNDIAEDDINMMGHLYWVAKQLAKQQAVDAAGYRLVMNCNKHGGQEVYHIHLHFLAKRQMTWPPG